MSQRPDRLYVSLGKAEAEERKEALQNLADEMTGGNISAMIQMIADKKMEVGTMGPKLVVRKDRGGFVDWGNGHGDSFERMHADAANRWPPPITTGEPKEYRLDQDDIERVSVRGEPGRLHYD